MKKIVVIHGANLDLLGRRQPEIYGKLSLEQLNDRIREYAAGLDIEPTFQQSNIEGDIVELIHGCGAEIKGIIINPGGYAHSSVAILDALLAANVPAVEVHLSNLHRREEFRQNLITARGAVGIISGFGVWSYLLAIQYLASAIQ